MLKLASYVAAIGFACGVLAPPVHAQTRSYRVPANDAASYNLRLCSSVVDFSATGDTDTDLDFVITDDRGNVVHRDMDRTDITYATLRPDVSAGCRNWTLRIANLGDVYNQVTVSMTDRGRSAGSRTGDGRNRYVSIHNHTGETVREMYWSRTDEDDWKHDRLGSGVMRARTNRSFNIDDGTGACHFDFRVILASGERLHENNVNVCSVSAVEFGDQISH